MAGEGVPAGATHVCRFCNAYWRLHPESGKYERVEWFNGTGHYCVAADLVPIAEAGPAPTTAVPPAPLGTCDLSDEPHEEGEHAEAYGDEPGDCQPCRNWSEAETPAPTTAAPAEQLSGKVVEGQPPRECAFCDTTEVNGVNINECSSCLTLCCTAHSEDADNQRVLCINCAPEDEPVPAEQPGKADEGDHADDCTDPNCHKRHTIPAGKAADPRPAHPTLPSCDAPEGMAWVCPECQSWATLRENAHAHQIKTGHRPPSMKSRPRPAQPQAPAEPTPEQIAKAGRVLAAVMDAERRGENMDPIIARALAEVAAPLREERDRLAGELAEAKKREWAHGNQIRHEQERWITAEAERDRLARELGEARSCGLQNEQRLRRERDAERAKVAERDARIATLEVAKDCAYRERNQCVALIVRMALRLGWRAGIGRHEDKPGEQWEEDWRTLVSVDLPTGQASWHFHDSHKSLLVGIPRYSGTWDGHDTEEKYRRVRVALVAPEGQAAAPSKAPLDAPREARKLLDFARGYGEAARNETTTKAAMHYLRERLCDAAKEYEAAALSAPPPPVNPNG